MRFYTVYSETAETAAVTLIEIMNSANSVIKVMAVGVTQEGSETSDEIAVELKRLSAGGTATTITAVKEDAGDSAFGGVCKNNHTVEPTYVSEDPVWAEGFNALAGATHAWSLFEAPTIRAGTGNGIGLKLDLAPAASMTIRAWLRICEIG
jgi:hypothetical protein